VSELHCSTRSTHTATEKNLHDWVSDVEVLLAATLSSTWGSLSFISISASVTEKEDNNINNKLPIKFEVYIKNISISTCRNAVGLDIPIIAVSRSRTVEEKPGKEKSMWSDSKLE